MKRRPNFTLRLDEVSMKKLKYIAAGGNRGIGPPSGPGAKGDARIVCHEKEKRSKAGFAP